MEWFTRRCRRVSRRYPNGGMWGLKMTNQGHDHIRSRAP